MCMIIHIPVGKSVKDEILKRCAKSNPHGFGMMYSHKKELCTFYSLNSEEFINKFKSLHKKYGSKTPFALHFRYATSGKNDLDNCHPFLITKDVGVMHNGIFKCVTPTETLSDTAVFTENILKPLDFDFMNNDTTLYLIKKYITTSNKLLFMNNLGEVKFINKDMGKVHDDIWYSSYVYGIGYTHYYGYGGAAYNEYDYEDESDYSMGGCLDSPLYGKTNECDNCHSHLYSKEELQTGLCTKCLKKYSLGSYDVDKQHDATPLDIMCCSYCNTVVKSDEISKIISPAEVVHICMDCLYLDIPISDFLSYRDDGENSNDEDDPSTLAGEEPDWDSLSEDEWKQQICKKIYTKLFTESAYEDGKRVLKYWVTNRDGEKIEATQETYKYAQDRDDI